MLSEASGRSLTGFYTLDGRRCSEYSEFVDDIQPGRMLKANGSWTFAPRGQVIPRPSLGNPGYNFLVQKLVSQGKRIPQTPVEKVHCPVLIRAALMVNCPKNSPLPIAQKTIEIKNALGVIVQRRCSVASSIQVQLKLEQVFEIEAEQPFNTIDTFADKSQTGVVTVSQITRLKYGVGCPPGTTRQEDSCVY